MEKSEIRKKILKIRKKNISRNLEIDTNKILNILRKNKTTNKIGKININPIEEAIKSNDRFTITCGKIYV